MKVKLATNKIRLQLIEDTSHFVNALTEGSYDYVYEELITLRSIELLAAMAWPLIFYKSNNIDFLFTRLDQDPETNIVDSLSLAFQMDAEGCRTGVFRGFTKSFTANRWGEFDAKNAQAFLDGKYAVLAADTPAKPLFILFVRQKDDTYRVDFEALWLFSMGLQASIILEIANQALATEHKEIALEYYALAAKIKQVYTRIENLICKHPVIGKFITPLRKHEIHEQLQLTAQAQAQYNLLKQDDNFPLETVPQTELTRVREILEARYSEGELQTLCFDIGLGYDDLPGRSRADKARELITYMHRRNRFHDLITAIRKNRPDILM